jgi:hypothetical protein
MEPPSHLSFVLLVIQEPSARPMVATAQSSREKGITLFAFAWNPIRGLTFADDIHATLTHSHSVAYRKVDWVFEGNIKTNLKQVATRAGGDHFPEPAISFDLRSSSTAIWPFSRLNSRLMRASSVLACWSRR